MVKIFNNAEKVTCRRSEDPNYIASCKIEGENGVETVDISNFSFNLKEKHLLNIDKDLKTFSLTPNNKNMNCNIDEDDKLFCDQGL